MKYYAIFLCFLISTSLSAQSLSNYNKSSIEGAIGAHIPFGPMGAGESSDYTGFERFDLGYRHMFFKNWGVKLQYSYDAFLNRDDDSGIVYNRVSISAVYNVGQHIFPLRRRVGMLTHLGLGYARASPEGSGTEENTGTLNFGIIPQLHLTERFALFLDFAYIVNFRQHYDFTGKLMSINYASETGSFATFSVGIMFYLGNNRMHADWY